jgi:hypothetical protein
MFARCMALFTGASLLALSSVPACVKHDRQTQITLALTAETRIPKELDGIEVVVTAPNGSEVSRVFTSVRDGVFFPQTLAVIPADEDSLRGAVKIEVSGFVGATKTQVFRRAIVSYVEGRTLFLPMPLRMACFEYLGCGIDETCAGGTCQPARVDGTKLADFDEALVFESAAGATCFDEETCLGGAQKVLDLNDDCTFALPDGVPSTAGGKPQVNVAIRWHAAGDRIIALDEGDAVEGWTLVGPRVGKISPGVCIALKEAAGAPPPGVPDKAEDAWITTACAPKTGLQPYCRDRVTGHVGIGRPLP